MMMLHILRAKSCLVLTCFYYLFFLLFIIMLLLLFNYVLRYNYILRLGLLFVQQTKKKSCLVGIFGHV